MKRIATAIAAGMLTFGLTVPAASAFTDTHRQENPTTTVVRVDRDTDEDDSDKTGLWGLAGLLGLLGLAGLAGRKRNEPTGRYGSRSTNPAPPTAEGASGTDH